MSHLLALRPRDPVIARDGRPFGDSAGNRMRSLAWPVPSTVAGAIRSMLGYAAGGNFDAALIQRLKQVACHGPLPVSGSGLFLPAAHDALAGAGGSCVTLRPEEISVPGAGVDLPGGLWPVLPPTAVALRKFDPPPAWWSLSKMTDWLLAAGDAPGSFFQPPVEFRNVPCLDERTHVQIDPDRLAAAPNLLFSSAGLVLDDLVEADGPPDRKTAHATELLVRVDGDLEPSLVPLLTSLDGLQTVGGERRLMRIRQAGAGMQSQFDCPLALQQRLSGLRSGDGVRMVLATPAIFRHGWRPDWLDEEGHRVGAPPGVDRRKLKLRLVAVSNQRWDAVSGWSYEPPRGPKAVRRTVPAGGVYFFRIEAIDSAAWGQLWLQPVSDGVQDRHDGFGLAVWGPWNKR